MTVLLDELREIATDMGLDLYHGSMYFINHNANDITSWPCVLVDMVKSKKPIVSEMGSVGSEWDVNILFLNKDEPESIGDSDNTVETVNGQTPTNEIIEAERTRASEFIQRMLSKKDTSGRQVFTELEPSEDEVIYKDFDLVLSGIRQPIKVTPLDKAVIC